MLLLSTYGFRLFFKIFRPSHRSSDLVDICIGDSRSAFANFFTHQLRYTAFNIIDDLIAAFFIHKMPAKTFNICLQFFVCGIFYRYYSAAQVNIYDLFHLVYFLVEAKIILTKWFFFFIGKSIHSIG